MKQLELTAYNLQVYELVVVEFHRHINASTSTASMPQWTCATLLALLEISNAMNVDQKLYTNRLANALGSVNSISTSLQ